MKKLNISQECDVNTIIILFYSESSKRELSPVGVRSFLNMFINLYAFSFKSSVAMKIALTDMD